MHKYEALPITIEAIRFDIDRWVYRRQDAFPMVDGTWYDDGMTAENPTLHTLRGKQSLRHGDYIIKHINGEYSALSADAFEQSYGLIVSHSGTI